MAENDFIINGFDYTDYITGPEELKLFNRLKELEPELYKPVKECIHQVIEFVQTEDKLMKKEPRKFIFQQPDLN